MSKLIHINKEYAEWVKSLSQRFRQSQIKAAVKVNSEMLKFYWSLGKDIVEHDMENKYGSGFFKNLSLDLKDEFPDVKGFSPTNLGYMKRFYLMYSSAFEIHPQPEGKSLETGRSGNHPQLGGKSENLETKNAEEIALIKAGRDIFSTPWGHHKLLIDKFLKAPEKAIFYAHKTVENGWSRSVLDNVIDTLLYEREGKAITNFQTALPAPLSGLAQEITRDPYLFDYTQLRGKYDETELKDALMTNVQKLLLELGNGFAFMGREYRMVVGGEELFCDMLFYNTHIHSYVIAEVKTRKFEPSFLGQLSGYVSIANHILKREGDNDTIGLLICKSKNEVMARYSLEGYNQPLGISEYELSKVFPEDFKSSLPSIEDIENELKEK